MSTTAPAAIGNFEFKSIDEVASQMPNSKDTYDLLPVDEIIVKGKSVVEIASEGNRETFEITEPALKTLASWLGVPASYVLRTPDDLFIENMKFGLKFGKEAYTSSKAIIKKTTHELTGWTDRRWNVLSNAEVLRAAASGIKDCQVHRYMQGDDGMELWLTGPELTTEVAMGDLHHFGVGVRYSDLAYYVPESRAQGHRQVCGNLMMSPYGIDGRHFKLFEIDADTLKDRFAQASRRGVEFIQSTMIPKIQETLTRRVTDEDRYLRAISREFGISESVQGLVVAALKIGEQDGAGKHTVYAITNAMTRAANDQNCPESWKNRLRWIAGELTMADYSQHCQTCFQKIN